MTPASSSAESAAQIRALIDDRINAVRNRDVDAAMSSIAPDILSFDVVGPLQRFGSDALTRAEEWFASFQGPLAYEIGDLSISAGDDVAFAFGLSHVNGTKTGGGQLDMWWRTTFGFHKHDGKWLVTHEHNSVPFDVESGKASLDLKPSL